MTIKILKTPVFLINQERTILELGLTSSKNYKMGDQKTSEVKFPPKALIALKLITII